MINIKGKVSEAIIYTDKLDSGSEGLIKALCNSEISEGSKIRIMPDVHPGLGAVIGLTMTVKDKVAPGLVGVDIGCGVSVTKIKAKKNIELQKLDKFIRSGIPYGLLIRVTPHRFIDEIDLGSLHCAKHIQLDKAFRGIGTLGGGNHFIELDKDIDNDYYISVHTGSRHLGVEVEGYYHKLAYENSKDKVPYEFAYLEGEKLEEYIEDMAIVQKYAELNRRAITDDICKAMKFNIVEELDVFHNYIQPHLKLIRKGAIAAHLNNSMVIPLNMRDGILICKGLGNPDWNYSAPHGAGRLYDRQTSRTSFTVSQYKKEMQGIYTSCINSATLDESPMAYKDSESIMEVISPTAQIVNHLKPVYNFKSDYSK